MTHEASRQPKPATGQSAEFLQTVIDAIPDVLMVIDRQHRVVLANQAARDMAAGRDPAAEGLTCYQVFHRRSAPCSEPEHPCPLEQVVATKARVKVVHTHYDGQGNEAFVQISAAPMLDESGEVARIIELCRDITARTRAEQTLRSSEQMLRLIFEQANDGINISRYDPETHRRRLVSCNQRYVEMSGYTLDELAAAENLNPLAAYHHSDDERKQWAQHILEGKPFSGSASWKRPDGKENYYEWTAAPITIGDELLIVGVDRDITERRQTEQRLRVYRQRLQALASQLIKTGERERRGIATYLHDTVAQSLALAVLKLGQLKDSSSSAGFRDELDDVHDLIRRSVRQARSLILDLSPPALYELGLQKAIVGLTDRMQAAHDIAIAVEDDGQTQLADLDSRVTVFRATQELLTNVVKHARARHVKISVHRDGQNIRVTVQDDGTGCDPNSILPHETIDDGFGLFSIRESITALGGQFEIHADPGQGTRATLIVPVKEEPAPAGKGTV